MRLTAGRDEHKRRSPACLFFSVEPLPKPKATRGKKGWASKASRSSAVSTTMLSVADTTSQTLELDLDLNYQSSLTNDTEATMPVAGKTTKGGKAKKGKKGAAKGKKAQPEPQVVDSLMEVDDEPIVVQPADEPRGKKRPSDEMDVDVVQQEEAHKPKRPATRTRASMAKPKPEPQPMPAPAQSEDAGDVETAESEAAPPPKAASKKRTKPGRKRASSRTQKSSKLSTASKASLRAAIPADNEIDAALEADLDRRMSVDDGGRQSLVSPPASSPAPKLVAEIIPTTASVASTRQQPSVSPSPVAPRRARRSHSSAGTRFESAPSNRTSGTAATDSEPIKPAPAAADAQTSPGQTTPANQAPVASPTPSPQSSDAENRPPSSRPSQTRPPLQMVAVTVPSAPPQPPSPSPQQQQPQQPPARTKRVALAEITPTRSPAKRRPADTVRTTCPWTAVDVEDILAGTPGPDNKENIAAGKAALASPEKRMTVEEWIQAQAHWKQERLRADCERMVGRFESDGMRALRAIEGIECAD